MRDDRRAVTSLEYVMVASAIFLVIISSVSLMFTSVNDGLLYVAGRV